MIRWVESLDQQGQWAGVTSFVTDPRTGETLTSDIVLENFQIKDYYVDRIDAYLQSVGASPGIYPNNWGPAPLYQTTNSAGEIVYQPMSATCAVGQSAPILPQVVYDRARRLRHPVPEDAGATCTVPRRHLRKPRPDGLHRPPGR